MCANLAVTCPQSHSGAASILFCGAGLVLDADNDDYQLSFDKAPDEPVAQLRGFPLETICEVDRA